MIEILELRTLDDVGPRLTRRYAVLQRLLETLKHKNLPEGLVLQINKEIEMVNGYEGIDAAHPAFVARAEKRIWRLLEKEGRLVPVGYYAQLWMGLGMAVFGVPIGLALSQPQNHAAYLPIGIAIGLSLGLSIGGILDHKARREGRQLDLKRKC
ncbi:MAG: hypothetical protein LWW85_02880 [Marinilabiliales bacterium]|nr:hypothetical protein [Marinilabiliales bacterium]